MEGWGAAGPLMPGGSPGDSGQRLAATPRHVLRGAMLVVVAALLPLMPLPADWILPSLAIVLMVAGLALGPLAALGIAILTVLLALLEQRPADASLALAFAFVPLISAAAGGAIGLSLRRVRREAETSARRARLLAEALLRLPTLESAELIYRELPLMLREILGFTHADILVPSADGQRLQVQATLGWTPPQGISLPLQSITGRALRTRRVQHVPDTQSDPDFVQGVGIASTHSELALPIVVGEQAVAVLNIERSRPGAFLAGEVATLEALVLAVGDALGRLGRLTASQETTYLQNFLLDFSRQITQPGTPQAVAHRALQLLMPFASADVGVVWLPGGGAPHLLARHVLGDFDAPDVPSPLVASFKGLVPREPVWVASSLTSPYSAARQLEAGLQSFAILPLLEPDGRPQAILELLFYRSPVAFVASQRQALQRAADRLHIALQGILATSRLADLLEALHALGAMGDIQELCDQALSAAIRLVPGANAATLWLSDGTGLDLRAAKGYDEAGAPPHWALQSVEDAVQWYGGDRGSFMRGLPHVLEQAPGAGGSRLMRLSHVTASICLPLVLHGDLVGLLSIDSLLQPEAFSQEALSLAGMFGLQLAVLLTQGRHRKALTLAARTDTLTGIGNRRDFDERIAAAWGEARRYRQPLSLVILDLQGFKAINDQYGHLSGDEALMAVARALNSVRRDGDTVFRWGGDEFAILLTHADLSQALQAASRYLDAIRTSPVLWREEREVYVGARLGVAASPEDADSIEGLVRVADERVIMAKRLGQSLSPAGPPIR